MAAVAARKQPGRHGAARQHLVQERETVAEPVPNSGYLGHGATFDLALTTFADSHADQNERDSERFGSAAKAGEIKVESEL